MILPKGQNILESNFKTEPYLIEEIKKLRNWEDKSSSKKAETKTNLSWYQKNFFTLYDFIKKAYDVKFPAEFNKGLSLIKFNQLFKNGIPNKKISSRVYKAIRSKQAIRGLEALQNLVAGHAFAAQKLKIAPIQVSKVISDKNGWKFIEVKGWTPEAKICYSQITYEPAVWKNYILIRSKSSLFYEFILFIHIDFFNSGVSCEFRL